MATTYEALRRREYELISNLLTLLPKIDNLDESRVLQVRDALFHADHPFLMVFVGPFSSGKSSLINALLGKPDLLRVGPIPTTDRIHILRWADGEQRMDSGNQVDTVFYPSPLLQKVSFVDTPGLESVFQTHEETTRRFLHRSDVVILVMLATQAMTSRNLEYLQMLRGFGKKIIIMVNQADLLSDEERKTVTEYVTNQSEDKLGYKPEVWLVSAKKGLQAKKVDTLDQQLWRESGLDQLESYIEKQLSDVDRMKQKLQTPLQIIQNVNQVALEAVQANQSVLDQYQSITGNVEQQLASYKREQEKIVREVSEEVRGKFKETIDRGGEAIQDIFQLSRALSSVWRGFTELIGLARLFRRGQQYSYTRLAFERYNVFEPIRELPDVVDKLAPRLEGKDMQDVDDLVKYAKNEVTALPENIRDKVIGDIQSPLRYDRGIMQSLRPKLEAIEDEALKLETETLDRSLRNVLFALAIWEVLAIVGTLALLLGGGVNDGNTLIILILLVSFGLIGVLLMPLMGRVLKTQHANRTLKIEARYIEALSKSADEQVKYGMKLRRDVVAPLTRLVESQTQIQTDQLNQLQQSQQEMVSIESDLVKIGSRNLFGIRG
ncbi:MAG: dynamin family protein [Aggregatilineales bacterium]